MITNVNDTLHLYEEMVSNGEIETFEVFICDTGLKLVPTGSAPECEIQLAQELQDSIQTYFYEITSFVYRSFDYTTLKSLINARMSLERMTKNAGV